MLALEDSRELGSAVLSKSRQPYESTIHKCKDYIYIIYKIASYLISW